MMSLELWSHSPQTYAYSLPYTTHFYTHHTLHTLHTPTHIRLFFFLQYNYDQQSYDQQYQDQQYGGEGQQYDGAYNDQTADPLATWQEGQYGEAGGGAARGALRRGGVGPRGSAVRFGMPREGPQLTISCSLLARRPCTYPHPGLGIDPDIDPTHTPSGSVAAKVAVRIPGGDDYDDDSSTNLTPGGYGDEDDYRCERVCVGGRSGEGGE